jgi:hypothetical protein
MRGIFTKKEGNAINAENLKNNSFLGGNYAIKSRITLIG